MDKEILINFINQKKSIRQISKIVNKSYNTTKYWINKYNLKTNPYKTYEKKCQFCGKLTKNPKYCSFNCQREEEWSKRKEQFEKNGIIGQGISEISFRRFYKRYLIEKRGHKCEICNETTWNKQKIPLILDHINGNSSNWDLINLRLVCGNCDMQLPTYKSKNKGNGRAYRRQRYAEGKSY